MKGSIARSMTIVFGTHDHPETGMRRQEMTLKKSRLSLQKPQELSPYPATSTESEYAIYSLPY